MTNKALKRIVSGNQVSDGAGVQLRRLIGSPDMNMLDPFLLFDAFGSDRPQDYLAGFPPHPHRGFETVTYLLDGKMRHEDSAGHRGVIESGGVQWMTAGRGIVHSEMPEQEEGLLAGFQLWVNLPASEKMCAPRYQEYGALEIPVETHDNGMTIKVVAGQTDHGTKGVIDNPYVNPLYLHVKLPVGKTFRQQVAAGNNSFVYLIRGQLLVGDSLQALQTGQLGVLGSGSVVKLTAEQDSEFLLVSGQPLNEPVARGGPFVMNTEAEIAQAFADYRRGRFA